MNAISDYFIKNGLDVEQLLLSGGIMLVGSILLGAIGRFVFGKRSSLSTAVSSAIGILFVYALNIVLCSAGVRFESLTTPLPFITIGSKSISLFQFDGADYTAICSELVNLILLAFLMNLIDRFMPRGKHIYTWLPFRCAAVILAQIAYIAATFLLSILLPEGFLTYAPAIVLAILLLMLLTGALKLLVGLFLTTVNPLIAAFYTFFFANIVGKQITRAILTTGILAALVYGLGALGITTISIATGALVAYIPFVIVLLALWYFFNKLF